MAAKISWFVKEDGSYAPKLEHYAGSFSSGDKMTLFVQVWNNRWGTKDVDNLANAVMLLEFDTTEDASLLPLCSVVVGENDQRPIIINGKTARCPLGLSLSGVKNNGDPESAACAQNFCQIRLEIDLSEGRFKANDLKNLYLSVVPLE